MHVKTEWLFFAAVIFSLAALAPLLAAPMINDITTTPDDPPEFRYLKSVPPNQKRDLSYPKKFAEKQKKAYPDLSPLKTELAPDDAFKKVGEVAARTEKWAIALRDPRVRQLEAVATTKMMRYKDDIVIQVRPSGSGSEIHMRSKSRKGKGDLGANAKRIRMFLSELEKALKTP